MQHLAYIPNQIDKQKLQAQIEQYNKLQNYRNQPMHNKQEQNHQVQRKKLTRQELECLLQRLTNTTNKEYNTQQQTAHILAANLQIKKRREEGDKVENRLIDYGKKNQQKKEELAKEINAQYREKYYRQVPEITSKAKNLHQKAIDKRLDELMQSKTAKREELKEKYGPKFQPEINPQSDFINDLQNYGGFHNRMETREKEAIKRRDSLLKCLQQKNKQECTFKPIINSNSKNIAQNLPQRKPLSVATPKVKKQVKAAQEINRQIYPFAPAINRNTETFLNKKGNLLETDCFRRLYNNAKDMLAKHEQKVQQRNRAYTFQPQLNTRSLKLAGSLQKRSKEETINEFSDKGSEDEYQQIRIGNSVNNYSRQKTYSVKNMKKSKNEWQDNLKQNCFNVIHRSGKAGSNLIHC